MFRSKADSLHQRRETDTPVQMAGLSLAWAVAGADLIAEALPESSDSQAFPESAESDAASTTDHLFADDCQDSHSSPPADQVQTADATHLSNWINRSEPAANDEAIDTDDMWDPRDPVSSSRGVHGDSSQTRLEHTWPRELNASAGLEIGRHSAPDWSAPTAISTFGAAVHAEPVSDGIFADNGALPICGCVCCMTARLGQASAALGDEQSGQQDYVLFGQRWSIDPLVHEAGSTVTWSIATANYSQDPISFSDFIVNSQFVNAIREAFDAWEDVTNIEFIETSDNSSVDIRLGWDALDGASGTLGIANFYYSPSTNILSQAFIRFDTAESWNYTIGSASSGIGAYVVAIHEIGHAIGIAHSDNANAVMASYYNRSLSGLTQDDIDAAQAIYGDTGGGVVDPPTNEAPEDLSLSSTSVVENASSGITVGSFSTDDPNSNDTHTYSIRTSQSDSGWSNFTISGNQLRVASGADLDYEDDSSIRIVVRSTDSGGLWVDQTFDIQISNRVISDISMQSGGSVSESASGGTAVASFVAYEASTLEPDAQFNLISDAGGLFELQGTTLFLADGATLDYESSSSHTVRISATDGTGSSREENFTIQVDNVSITDVAMQSGGAIAENAVDGAVVATFTALEDGTATPADWTLLNDAGGRFVLEGNTLKVATGASLDFESSDSHTVRIEANDGSGGSIERNFVIDIVNTPISDIELTSGGSVDEGAAAGTVAAVFQAFDDDLEETAQWTLTDDADGRFVLDGNVLKVAADADLDFEQSASHSVTIGATDGNGAAREETFNIAVANTAISDIEMTSGGTVLENSAAGTAVAEFAALEGSNTADAVFSLIDDANGLFVLDGSTLRIAPDAAIDYESATSHTVRVGASEAGEQAFEEEFVIQIANMALSSIAFASGGSIDENADDDAVVAVLEASENPVEPTAQFSLLDDADGRFYLDGNQLRVADGSLLDFEDLESHTVRIGATDGTGPQVTQDLIIQVNDVSGETIFGTPQSDELVGTVEDDIIRALSSDDEITGSPGPDSIDGGGGTDTVVYDGVRADFDPQLLPGDTIRLLKPDGTTDTLTNIERIDLIDGDYVYDIDSDNTGFGYRIYQAAFGRTPDEGGVRFWIDVLDSLDEQGWSQTKKQQYVASAFNDSDEFRGLYGDDPSNYDYIDAMYQNVLFRLPDQEGYDFWVGSMEAGLSREDILVAFAESDENVANNIENLDDGIWVV